MSRNRVLAVMLSAVLAGGCATARSMWPFGGKPEIAATPVTELVLQLPVEGIVPVVLQYWERNTLIVDLQAVGSQGSVTLLRQQGHAWPARIAFRMAPRRFDVLEVVGAQRAVLPVSAGGSPATAELPSALHDERTAALEVRWGATGAF